MLPIILASFAQAAPTVALTGTCPGNLDVDISGATPGASVATATANNTGSTTLPAGAPCAGTTTGLSAAGLTQRATVTADGAGNAAFSVFAPAGACGMWGQAVDLTTCQTSNTVQIPAGCTFTPDPSNAVGESGAMVGVTALHNEYRERVGVPRLFWSAGLAAAAQAYADTCPGLNHDPNRHGSGGYGTVGENIAVSTSSAYDGVNASQGWIDERYLYPFGETIELATFGPYGHYTQVVWDTTEAVGCGIRTNCGSPWRTQIICRYGESGNWLGQTPYDYSAGACYDLDNDDVLQASDPDDTNAAVP